MLIILSICVFATTDRIAIAVSIFYVLIFPKPALGAFSRGEVRAFHPMTLMTIMYYYYSLELFLVLRCHEECPTRS